MDLKTAAGQKTKLTEKPDTRGEYFGPCPICGGEDRFIVNTKSEKQLFYCRNCHVGGDFFDFIQWINNCDYAEALAIIEGQSDEIETSFLSGDPDSINGHNQENDSKLAQYIYRVSKCDPKPIQRYFLTRSLNISNDLIESMGIRFNEYQGQKAVIIPIKTPENKLVQIQRILIDGQYQKQDKRFSGRYSDDRGLLIIRNPKRLLIVEGIEDLMTIALHSTCNASFLCSFGTAGFSKIQTFIDQYSRVAVLLDPDKNGASLKASEKLPDRVKRLMPSLEPGLDANGALQKGIFRQWLKSVKAYG